MSEFICGGGRGLSAKGCCLHDKQLNTYDYLADVPGAQQMTDLVEVQFKNTHKDYYINSNHLTLQKGDIVAVEGTPGHDIGTVSLTGPLVPLQMSKQRLKADAGTKRIYRLAREVDIEKYNEAKAREQDTMIRSRAIAKELGLDMKIGDVEFQGDGNKAIFYYIADQRVDFRELIKVLAQEFGIRIEMRQIGARQEAGLIGGFGPCGREMCCATWLKNFNTVSTGAARCQDVSLNPQKLAGQCGKLKCCLNYEVANYLDAQSRIPRVSEPLEFEDGPAWLVKTDILREIMYFSYEKGSLANIYALDASEVREIIKMNRNGIRPESLKYEPEPELPEFVTAVGDDSITRFDTVSKKRKKKGGSGKKGENRQGGQGQKGRRPSKQNEGQQPS